MRPIFSYAKYFLTLMLFISLSACKKQFDSLSPHNVNFEGQQFSTPEGYNKVTLGNYASLNGDYEEAWFNISEFRGNNVKLIDASSTSSTVNARRIDAFNFTNSASKDFGLSNSFWLASYKALLGINLLLKNVSPTETNATILQAKAENLFLRAFINFNLVRVYGMPFYQNPQSNPGIPLILAPLDVDANPPARATVAECYNQIITDLQNAIISFKSKSDNGFASKYAAYALLSRVYAYMSGTFEQPNIENAKLSIKAADSVILNGGYNLLTGSNYTSYYAFSNLGNNETIWAFNHSAGQTTLPTLLMQPKGPNSTNYRTGAFKPSPDLLSLLQPTDLRANFYFTDPYPGNLTDLYSTGKYSFGYSTALTSAAPFHHLRLAEVYLNRAEAKVKAGDNTGALADLNIIHQRAGLTALTAINGKALLIAILQERRLELAFEGHISYDYFRNGLSMQRNYTSFNSLPITIAPTDPKVVMRISQDVLTENPNIIQNIQ